MLPLSWSFRDWNRALTALGMSVFSGAAIWWASPLVTLETEPWDADGNYYTGALFAAGFLAALVTPRAIWISPIGVYAGQLAYGMYLFKPEAGSLWPLGLIVAAAYCVATFGGAFTGAVLVWILSVMFAMTRLVVRLGKRVGRTNRPLESRP